MLADRFSQHDVTQILADGTSWVPYPNAGDRSRWQSLAERKGLIAAGTDALDQPWPALPATLFLEFVRHGNRSVYEHASMPRRQLLGTMVLAACADGSERFLDAVLDAVWSICEESYWGISAHLHMQQQGAGLPDVDEPTVDLFAAETGALLAWTQYLLGAQLADVSPLLTQRIETEIRRRILIPCRERNDFWWMGLAERRPLNNWTPWCCSNWLTAELLIESDPAVRAASVHKIMRCLDAFVDPYPRDGGCDEGTSYWGRAAASLFDCLDLLRMASNGRINLLGEPLVRDMGAYLYRMHIADGWFVNFADGGARFAPYGPLVYRFGKATGDQAMTDFGAWVMRQHPDGRLQETSIGRMLPALFLTADAPADATPPYVRDAWLAETQVLTTRCRTGTPQGFFVAAKGGHNAESHNHNDVGNVIVFRDGSPLLVDAGVATYTAKTFSAQRYDIWTMQSSYHNLPEINGVMQQPGARARARDVSCSIDSEHAELILDIAPAYPDEAGLEQCMRTVTLVRESHVLIRDEVVLSSPAPEIVWNLLTPCAVRTEEGGILHLIGPAGGADAGRRRASFRVTPATLTVSVTPIDTSDTRLVKAWPHGLNRIRLSATDPDARATFELRID